MDHQARRDANVVQRPIGDSDLQIIRLNSPGEPIGEFVIHTAAAREGEVRCGRGEFEREWRARRRWREGVRARSIQTRAAKQGVNKRSQLFGSEGELRPEQETVKFVSFR